MSSSLRACCSKASNSFADIRLAPAFGRQRKTGNPFSATVTRLVAAGGGTGLGVNDAFRP